MVSVKTLATNVRSALNQVRTAASLVEQELAKQQNDTRDKKAIATAELRDALAITFSDKRLASSFRETITGQQPQLVPMVAGYKKEYERLATWLSIHREQVLRQNIEVEQKQLEQALEDSKKSVPALVNNMAAIEKLVLAAVKEGLVTPPAGVEVAPEAWLSYLETIEYRLQNTTEKKTWWLRGKDGVSALAKEAQAIEKRSREGWPTIMLHAKQSLLLHKRLLQQQEQVQQRLNTYCAELAQHQENASRLADLQEMGEESYVLAHADDRTAAALAQCLDTSIVGNAAQQQWETFQELQQQSRDLKSVVDILKSWVAMFQTTEHALDETLLRHNQDISDAACDALHAACTCMRRTATLVQRWVETRKQGAQEAGLNDNAFFTEASIDSLVRQSHQVISTAAQSYQNDVRATNNGTNKR